MAFDPNSALMGAEAVIAVGGTVYVVADVARVRAMKRRQAKRERQEALARLKRRGAGI